MGISSSREWMRGEGVGGGERHSSGQGGGRQPQARSRGQPTPSTAAQRQALQASRRSGLGTAVLRQTVGQPRHEGQSRTFPEDTAWDIQGDEGKRVEQQYPRARKDFAGMPGSHQKRNPKDKARKTSGVPPSAWSILRLQTSLNLPQQAGSTVHLAHGLRHLLACTSKSIVGWPFVTRTGRVAALAAPGLTGLSRRQRARSNFQAPDGKWEHKNPGNPKF